MSNTYRIDDTNIPINGFPDPDQAKAAIADMRKWQVAGQP